MKQKSDLTLLTTVASSLISPVMPIKALRGFNNRSLKRQT